MSARGPVAARVGPDGGCGRAAAGAARAPLQQLVAAGPGQPGSGVAAQPLHGTGGPLPRLAVAFDGASLEPFEPIIDALAGLPVAAKVGASLFCAVGPAVVRHFQLAGMPVFLDLKFHDIPHQVARAVDAVARREVEWLTVHASGGAAMLRAAVDAARGRTRVIAVSVLTSLGEGDLAAVGLAGAVGELVARQCRLAFQCGAAGAVLSPRELALVADLPRSFVRVTPGVRAALAADDDQQRTATCADAIAGGADLVVVGRPIVAALDPRAAALEHLAAIGAAKAWP